jgi:hypothetical protein
MSQQTQDTEPNNGPYPQGSNGKDYNPQPEMKSGNPQTKNKSSHQDAPEDIYSPEAMAVKSGDTVTASGSTVVKLPKRITVQKASKQAYFRSNLDFHIKTSLIPHESSKAYYYPIGSEVRDALSEFIRTVELFGCVTLQGDFFFWPLSVSEIENEWTESAREILELAQDEWVGYRSMEGRYAPRHPGEEHGNPIWPDTTMQDLLSRAFRGTRTIKDLNHRVVLSLLGKRAR